ncbi:MAG: Nif11-like leader peptide family natural product precursor [Cyanobacteria bacterium M_surface_9_m1_291]|nr:Nif11-like leader peptide family natural product precursor [Cyanobacteria bacterium M_surface_9_m1_291]
MSEDQLQAFLTRVKDDTALQKQLSGIKDFAELQALGRSLGFELTRGDATQTSELSDEELESVTGGTLDKVVAGVSLLMLNPACAAVWGGLKLVDALTD